MQGVLGFEERPYNMVPKEQEGPDGEDVVRRQAAARRGFKAKLSSWLYVSAAVFSWVVQECAIREQNVTRVGICPEALGSGADGWGEGAMLLRTVDFGQ